MAKRRKKAANRPPTETEILEYLAALAWKDRSREFPFDTRDKSLELWTVIGLLAREILRFQRDQYGMV